MSILGTSDVDPNIAGFYDTAQLYRAVPARCYGKYGEQKQLPTGEGTKITFHRWASPPAMTTPLSDDGETPDPWTPSITRPTCTIYQYGGYVNVLTWLTLVGPDPYLAEMAELNGEQQGTTWDTLDRAVLTAGSSVRYANDVAARTSIVTAPAINDIKAIVRFLEGNDARKMTKMVEGGPKISTTPIPPAYRAITHTDCRQDWEDIEGFIPVEKYPNQSDVQPTEIGQVSGIRVETTTNAKIWTDSGGSLGTTGLISTSGSNIDVYSTIIMAEGAYGTVALTKETSKNIVKKPLDPLEQRMTSGWKGVHGGIRLNENFMIRFEHGCTDY